MQELGTGKFSSVKVSLKNHKVIHGYIKESFDEYFILTDSPEIGNYLRIYYSEVHKIEIYSERKTAKRALKVAAVVGGAVALLSFLLYSTSD